MADNKYLDYSGLKVLWKKIKNPNPASGESLGVVDTYLNTAKTYADDKAATLKSELETKINAGGTATTNLTTRVTAVENKASTNATNIATLQNQITGLTGAMHFKGHYDTLPNVTSFSAGDVVLVGNKEYVCCDNAGTKHWHELGDEGSFLTITEAASKYETISNVTSKVSNLQNQINGKADSSHTHSISDVTNLQSTLDGKQAKGDYATNSALNSAKATLQTAIDGKAASSHTHTIANITNLQATLDGKQAKGNYAKTDASNIFQNSQTVKNYLQVVPTSGTDSVKIGATSILRIDSRDQSETEFEIYWPTVTGTLALSSEVVDAKNTLQANIDKKQDAMTAITTAEINAL